MFVAQGSGGFRVYDIASIANKGFSERIITAPGLAARPGHPCRLAQRDLHGAAHQPADPRRTATTRWRTRRASQPDGSTISLLEENQEQRFHPIYNYAVVTDAEEGLILVNVDTLADGEARNNHLRRATFANGANAWNENGVLTGARHITLAGHYAYITANAGLVVVDLDNPLAPRVAATIPLNDARATGAPVPLSLGHRRRGPQAVRRHPPGPAGGGARRRPCRFADARRVYLARTYAYVAAGADGLVIVNVTRPEHPRGLLADAERRPSGAARRRTRRT